MCGIAGFYSNKNIFKADELEKMTNRLTHRGPDAQGMFFHGSVALGHRRLSIIDLSEAANQPMQSHNGRYVVAFNGEIYNFKELARELQMSFKTSSDTEVLLEAFATWGPGFVKRLNGMFAIAIYDKQEQLLHLFRDRMGIKPLFYYYHNKQLAFASEIKSLLCLNSIAKFREINPDAIKSFLNLGYLPGTQTIYKYIYKLPQGSQAVFDGDNLVISPYWRIKSKIENGILTHEADAKAQLNELVKDSVRYRLIADVPYGTFLSGGVDSSLVSAVAQKTINQQLKTFSIGFADAKFNETTFASNVAKYIGSDHHEFLLTEQDAIKMVPDIFESYDEPYADSSAIPTMLVSKMARQHVTMTLSGDGGDELFHGYGMYRWAKRLDNPLIRWNRHFCSQALSFGPSRLKRVAELLDFSSDDNRYRHIFSQEQYLFSERELPGLLKNTIYSEINTDTNFSDLARPLSRVEEQALFDLMYYLPDDLLVKVDRASMRYSLESRVPLLDYRIVEFALNLDERLKIKNGQAKYLLKQVLYDYVPKEIFDRPKWGFSIPLGKWLKGDLRFMIDDYLSTEVIQQAGFVNKAAVERLVSEFLSGKSDYLYNRIWLLICLHRWYIDVFKVA